MREVFAENLEVGMVVKTWFGNHTITEIKPYTGPFDFVLNILVLSGKTSMSNEQGAVYKVFN